MNQVAEDIQTEATISPEGPEVDMPQ
jgi:hypothetical protein